MNRTFCDGCGEEITNGTTGRALVGLETELVKDDWKCVIEVRVKASGPEIWPVSQAPDPRHWCRYCVLDAVTALDDRPRPPKAALKKPRIEPIDASVRGSTGCHQCRDTGDCLTATCLVDGYAVCDKHAVEALFVKE